MVRHVLYIGELRLKCGDGGDELTSDGAGRKVLDVFVSLVFQERGILDFSA